MSVTLVTEFHCKSGAEKQVLELLRRVVPSVVETAAGCELADVFRDEDTPSVLVEVAQWASRADHQRWAAGFRATGGDDIAAMMSLLERPPTPRYCSKIQL